ncbi:MAG: hypothetical protein CMB79_00625 [Filomicrobium sp.]|nr:hypothetical protein [Filomicrobium sp.]
MDRIDDDVKVVGKTIDERFRRFELGQRGKAVDVRKQNRHLTATANQLEGQAQIEQVTDHGAWKLRSADSMVLTDALSAAISARAEISGAAEQRPRTDVAADL